MAWDTRKINRMRAALRRWYRAHGRRLPWRAERPDPYHVLVSEAMLQQTQVATVIGYFNRFVQQLPTLRDLAAADEMVVLRLWQGLGYYRRARHLHAAAKIIVNEFDATVPETVDELLRLPGIGPYTAGAIASIAYDRPSPLLDGNVSRVLVRWFSIHRAVDDPKVRDELWSLATRLVPRTKPGEFNQALMELGALVCLPRGPQCPVCPVVSDCRARATGRAERLPVRLPRRRPKAVTHHIVAVERRGDFLFVRRPDNGLWSSMWQMPAAEHFEADVDEKEISVWVRDGFGVQIADARQVESFGHQTTHRTIRFVLWLTTVTSGRLRNGAGLWRKLNAIDDLPLPNPQRRAVAALRKRGKAENDLERVLKPNAGNPQPGSR